MLRARVSRENSLTHKNWINQYRWRVSQSQKHTNKCNSSINNGKLILFLSVSWCFRWSNSSALPSFTNSLKSNKWTHSCYIQWYCCLNNIPFVLKQNIHIRTDRHLRFCIDKNATLSRCVVCVFEFSYCKFFNLTTMETKEEVLKMKT